jgi:uncharacterized protein YndB with AHSA1/START domain
MSDLDESASTTIAAPPAVVFAILSDPRQHARIDGSGTIQGTVSGPDRLELGSRFGMSMKMGAPYRIRNRVVEFEQDRLIAWRHVGLHRWRYELTPRADGGTDVTETWDLSHHGRLGQRVLHALYGARTATALRGTMQKLKQAAEADASAA